MDYRSVKLRVTPVLYSGAPGAQWPLKLEKGLDKDAPSRGVGRGAGRKDSTGEAGRMARKDKRLHAEIQRVLSSRIAVIAKHGPHASGPPKGPPGLKRPRPPAPPSSK